MPGVTFFPLEDVPFLSLFFNFYGYYLPIFLYATWTATALFDLHIGKYRSIPSKITWTFILMFIPLVGPLIYHIMLSITSKISNMIACRSHLLRGKRGNVIFAFGLF